jgi:hypothetical protein
MTNNLTEAVRRLRELQTDVDRLQSGGDDGEIRELRSVTDDTQSDDNTSQVVRTATAVQYDQSSYDSGGGYS